MTFHFLPTPHHLSIKWLTLVETIIVTTTTNIQADIRLSFPAKEKKKDVQRMKELAQIHTISKWKPG